MPVIVPGLVIVPELVTVLESDIVIAPALVIVPELVMVPVSDTVIIPELLMVLRLVRVPVTDKVIPGLISSVSPELTVKSVIMHVLVLPSQVPPICDSHEL